MKKKNISLLLALMPILGVAGMSKAAWWSSTEPAKKPAVTEASDEAGFVRKEGESYNFSDVIATTNSKDPFYFVAQAYDALKNTGAKDVFSNFKALVSKEVTNAKGEKVTLGQYAQGLDAEQARKVAIALRDGLASVYKEEKNGVIDEVKKDKIAAIQKLFTSAQVMRKLQEKGEDVSAQLKAAGAVGAGALATYMNDLKKVATPENVQGIVETVKAFVASKWAGLAPDAKEQVTSVWDSVMKKLEEYQSSDAATKQSSSKGTDDIVNTLKQLAEKYGLTTTSTDKDENE